MTNGVQFKYFICNGKIAGFQWDDEFQGNPTGNRLLQSFSQVISLLFSSEHRKAFRNLATVRRSVKMHDEMIQAIRNKDLAALQQVIYRHITPL